jgi:hypothetical protein
MLSALLFVSFVLPSLGDAVRDQFDCKMRALAVEYAAHIQPWRPASTFSDLVDALNGSREKAAGCTVTVPKGLGANGRRFGPIVPLSVGGNFSQFFVAVDGSDSNNGSEASPFLTLPKALEASRANVGGSNQIILRAGTHYLSSTVVLTAADSGLNIQAFPGEEAWISGGVPLSGLTWKPFNVTSNPVWSMYPNTTAVYATSNPYPSIVNGTTSSADECQSRCQSNFLEGGPCKIWTWHDAQQGSYANQCWFRIDGEWAPQFETGHTTGRTVTNNVWVASLAGMGVASAPGLRLGGARMTRARFPNGMPETKGFMPPNVFRANWTPQQTPRAPDVTVNLPTPVRNTSISMFQTFTTGIGGTCDRFQPSAGYFCSPNVQGGGSVIYYVPIAMDVTNAVLPNLPYKNATGAVVQTWRPGHWASWMYEVGDYSYNGSTANFTFSKGGFQGSRGNDEGEDSYIENVFEELDAPVEYYYDEVEQNLYFYHNASAGTTPPSDGFVVPQLKALFNVTGLSPDAPARDITITGLGLRDTAYTYMDPHSLPSGGDWALERSAVVFIENAIGIDVQYNVFERVDGNCVILSGFVRNSTVSYNEFAWVGSTAVAAWGNTDGGDPRIPSGYGLDGSAGLQPRGNRIEGNLCHELGIWEKQSSCYTQFKASENVIARNIMYNGPRAHVNFNDGFRGGALVTENLIFNSCRESADHGPFNSWDRDPYTFDDVATGALTMTKAFDQIANNFIIANYNSLGAIDNDDGSAYYLTTK